MGLDMRVQVWPKKGLANGVNSYHHWELREEARVNHPRSVDSPPGQASFVNYNIYSKGVFWTLFLLSYDDISAVTLHTMVREMAL